MVRSLLLLLALSPAALPDAAVPVMAVATASAATPTVATQPTSSYFQANAAALVRTGDYRRDKPPAPPCGRSAALDRPSPCAGRDGLVVWRRGLPVQFAARGART